MNFVESLQRNRPLGRCIPEKVAARTYLLRRDTYIGSLWQVKENMWVFDIENSYRWLIQNKTDKKMSTINEMGH